MALTIDRKNLYGILKDCLKENYSIGIHGITSNRFLEDGTYVKDDPEDVCKEILLKGLNINANRTLLGTVAYNSDAYSTEEDYVNYRTYGDAKDYLIVALPKILKNSKGESIYVGSPTHTSMYQTELETQGYQLTSLADSLLPDYAENSDSQGKLDPMFIIGNFEVLDENTIRLKLNENHIAFHNDLVPDEYFARKKTQLDKVVKAYDIPSLSYDISIEEISDAFKNLGMIHDYFTELGSLSEGDSQKVFANFDNGDYGEVNILIRDQFKKVYTELKKNENNRLLSEFPILECETLRQQAGEKYGIDLRVMNKQEEK